MSEKKQRRRRALATGIALGVATFAALLATAISIGAGGDQDPPKSEAAVEAQAKDWAAIATGALGAGGFDFARARFDQGVLAIAGDAPDLQTRQRAFNAGKDAVLKDKEHLGTVLAFENVMTVNGETIDGVPDAASALGASPEAQACQVAYNTLLDGRVINFDSGSAIVANESKLLLGALADVAQRCGGYKVQIGGHTDARGDNTANQALSERRAQAVADYLVGQGVSATQIGVMGYGETAPLDASGSPSADAKNRRIEFKVEETPR
jgi:outer membrane protein OmpA-like peptidoglycan-associated protein